MNADEAPELHDRRQRAREAALDAAAGVDGGKPTIASAIESAIETATRVRIDKTLLSIAWAAYRERSGPMEGADDPDFEYVLVAAFNAAGFEIEV